MIRVDASNATVSIDWYTNGLADFASFLSASSTAYSWLTTDGNTIVATGIGIATNGSNIPTAGTITDITIDMNSDSPGTPDLSITGLPIIALTSFDFSAGGAASNTFFNNVLAGDTEFVDSPTGLLNLNGDFPEVDAGLNTGGNDIFTGIATKFEATNGDADDVNDGTLIGGDDQFTGFFSSASGDAQSLLTTASLAGGNDNIVFSSDLGTGSTVWGDARSVFESATLQGGDDLIDVSAISSGGSMLFGDAEESGGTIFPFSDSQTFGGNDTIIGGAQGDQIFGDTKRLDSVAELFGGNDSLLGGGGDDQIFGDYQTNNSTAIPVGGDDFLSGGAGMDTLFGNEGNDTLSGDAGDDTLDGGAGTDTATYMNDPNGVTVDLGSQTATDGFGNTDTFVSIEAAAGSQFNDLLFGRSQNDLLQGLGGDDLLFGSEGDDTLDGGSDYDTAIFDGGLFTTNGVFINNTAANITDLWNSVSTLALAHTVDKGFGVDQLIDIEGFNGSQGNDLIFLGDPAGVGVHVFDRAGDDKVTADQSANADSVNFIAGSGNDTLIGGQQRDRVDFRDDGFDAAGAITQGVNVDLAAGTAIDGWGNTDSLSSIERVTGSHLDDTLRGDGGRNDLRGMAGNDILDGAGGDDDRAEYSSDPAAVLADLALGTATDGFGGTDTLIGIERLRGSEFNDTLRGDGNDNEFEGSAGDDLIEGRGGNDYIEGGAGNDTLDGGAGDRDEVTYRHDDGPNGANVDLAAGIATDTFGNTDTLIGIERVRGSRFDDVISGNDQFNRLRGEEGDDSLVGVANTGDRGDEFEGGAGNDTLVGSAGQRDHADYQDGGGNVLLDLAAGTATDDFGDTDTLISIEEATTGDGMDTMRGNAEDNYLESRGGDDLIEGRGGNDDLMGGAGNDTLDGGSENVTWNGGDTARYDRDHERGGTQGINANLVTGLVSDTFGDIDTLIDIEEIRGSIFDDVILGSAEHERLRGGDGNDTIEAGDGNDDLQGGIGDDSLSGGVGGDFLQPGLGTDIVEGGANGPLFERDQLSYIWDALDSGTANGIAVSYTGENSGTVLDYGGSTDTFSGIEQILGTQNADSFTGTTGKQSYRGYGGNDTFDGGAGDEDEVDYSNDRPDNGASQGIDVSLNTGTGTDTSGDTDTFQNIERIRGSNWDDTIEGDANRNELEGEDGNDLIDSFGGENNFLDGGRGNDTLNARGDNDYAKGGDGNDLINLLGEGGGANPGLGNDTINGGTSGFFSIEYEGLGASVVIDTALGTTQITGGGTDVFTNIRNVQGGDGNDTLLGDDDAGSQEFFSSLGDDFIDGRGGGRDWLIMDNRDETAVTVDFGAGTATGVFAGNDTFVNIEGVRGSSGNDTFIGGSQPLTIFQGLDGVDSYTGTADLDRIDFSFDDNRGGTGAVTVDLAAGTATDGFGNAETFTSIEQAISANANDTLRGDGQDNLLAGVGGNDLLEGRGGDDLLFGGGDADTLTGGAGADEFSGRIDDLNGDTITDFEAIDSIGVYDSNFNLIGANITLVGNEVRIDTTGDGNANATMFLTNGYSGPINSVGGPVPGTTPATISIENDGLFSAAVEEGNTSVDLTVTRSGDTGSTATVDVTVTGTGANPADAADISSAFGTAQTVTFLPGETQATVTVDISEDTAIEPTEDLAVTLSNPTSTGTGGALLGGDQTFIRIIADDFPASVDITGGKSPEDSGNLTFTVTRTGDLSQDLVVDFDLQSAGGIQGAESDDVVGGLPASGSVTILAGNAQATFDVAIVADTVSELHDDVVATISSRPDWPAGLTVGVAQAIGSIRNDDGVPPTLPVGATGSNYGDPHLVTLDGLGYDFQAVGEFTLIESVSGDPLDIQVRFQPVPGSSVASQTTAVATMLGTARVVVDLGALDLVKVEGVAFDINSATSGTTVGNGQLFFDGESITVVYANGEQLRIDLHDGFMSTTVSVAAGRDLRGLLGNADGDTANDLALRDGTVLSQPVDFAVLYGAYADEWRITDASSLFDYPIGLGTADFTDPDFPTAVPDIGDFPTEIVAIATAAAAGIADPALRDAAILDFLMSGNASFIEAADSIDETITDPLVVTKPQDAPAIQSGIGVLASETTVTEGDSGAKTLVFTIYRTGDVDSAISVDFAIGGNVDSADFAGAVNGTVAFAAGERTKTVSIDVLGDELPEGDEMLDFSFVVTSGSAEVLSSSALVEIVGDDLATSVFGTSRNDVLSGTDGIDIIDGAGGNDLIESKSGADTVTLGAGSDTVKGALSDLFDDTISDFGVDDQIIFRSSRVDREAITVTPGSAVLSIDGDGDGTNDGSFTLEGDFSGGDFMSVFGGTDTAVTFETFLPDLAEGSAIAASAINGINNQAFLTGDGATGFRLTLDSAKMGAAFDNTVGVYEVDASGNIVDVRLLIDNVKSEVGASVDITGVEAGHRLGFFIVQDGADWASGLGDSDTFSFIDGIGGPSATTSGGSESPRPLAQSAPS